ncbi:acyl-protein thioesterase [Nesidiocoris tenuis]|uniref:palmitoyl-protein hydrolase n=1 Tax=Nesidiocoris tenuis TaxID=355587 RepID=A0ABN7AWJ7_9HEMI|nr:acyl-protein thioesterase [Nesidiocoris tenuis]
MTFTGIEILKATSSQPTAALVFLHGTGSSGLECKTNFMKFLGAHGHKYIDIYLPTARERYLKIQDKVTTFWFDAVRTGSDNMDVEGSTKDADEVSAKLEEIVSKIEATGIPRERIAIGGMSQGGMVSVYAAYVRGIKVGAVVSISASFPFHNNSKFLPKPTVPLLSIYGQQDAFIMPRVMDAVWKLFRMNKIPFTPKSLVKSGHPLDANYAKIMFEWLEKRFALEEEDGY